MQIAMNALPRATLAVALLAGPSAAFADDAPSDDALVTDPRMQPPPPPPPNQAPPPPPVAKQSALGGDLAVVIPLGDYSKGVDFAAGAMLRFDYAANPQVDITARLGYLWHKMDTDGSTLSMLPILVGGAFKLGGGPFLYGEVGFTVVTAGVDFMGIHVSDSKTYLSVGGGVGFASGKVKARAGLYMPGRPQSSDTGDRTTLYGVLATVGYDFAAL